MNNFVEEIPKKFITDNPVVYLPVNIEFAHLNLTNLKIKRVSPSYSMKKFFGPTQEFVLVGTYQKKSKYSSFIYDFTVEITLEFSNNFWNQNILNISSLELKLDNKSKDYNSSIYIHKEKGLINDSDLVEITKILKESSLKMKIDSEYKIKKKNKFFSNIFNKFKKA